jgi:hypothetical protein
MTPDTINALIAAISEHAWPVVAGLSILILVYLSKLPALGGYWDQIPKQYRPLVVAALGVLSGVAEALASKQPWLPALLLNLFAALAAIGTDQVATKPLEAPKSPEVPITLEK